MKYLAAYALLVLSGSNSIRPTDKKEFGDAQIKADDADFSKLLESVKGKPIHQLIAAKDQFLQVLKFKSETCLV